MSRHTFVVSVVLTLGWLAAMCMGAKWTVIDCGLWTGGYLAGKITVVDDIVCHEDKSCTCTESWKHCFYCDPEGLERNRTNHYDPHGEIVESDRGCDCRYACENARVQPSRNLRVLEETICVDNPFH